VGSVAAPAAVGAVVGAGKAPRKPKVAIGCPYRMHVLLPTAEVPDPTPDHCPTKCARQHVVRGKEYRYCACGLSKTQVIAGVRL
jgi:hypothetical protein